MRFKYLLHNKHLLLGLIILIAICFYVLDALAQQRAKYCIEWEPVAIYGELCTRLKYDEPWNKIAHMHLTDFAVYYIGMGALLAVIRHSRALNNH